MKTIPENTAPRAVRIDDVANILGISSRTWRRLVDAGLAPQPVRLGRRVLWRVDELDAWLEAGCPSMETWEVQQ